MRGGGPGGGGGGRGMSGGGGGGRGFSGGAGMGGAGRGMSPGRSGGYANRGGGGSMGPAPRQPGGGMPGMGMPGGMPRMPRAPRRRPPMGGMPAMGGGCMGCFMPFGSVMLIILVIALVMVMFGACSFGSGYTDYSGTVIEGDGIEREKLESNLCKESSQWIDDELGWLRSQSTVKNGMKDFYDQTGVQPYLIITDNINGKGRDVTDTDVEAYLEEKYDSLYSDEGHMIFLFDEYSEAEYLRYLYVGSAAKSVMDTSAEEIFLNLADRYYQDYSLSDDEYFAKIFTESANVLMKDYTAGKRTKTTVTVVLIVAIAIVVILLIVMRIQASKTKEAEHMQEILNTDIGASPSQEELLKKYGGDSTAGSSGSGTSQDSGGTSGGTSGNT